MSILTKVLLLNDTTDWYHFGCTATSIALKDAIVDLGFSLKTIPITETYKLETDVSTAEEFVDEQHYHRFVRNNPEFIYQVKNCDIVIINGEGLLHDMRPGPIKLLYFAYIAKKFLNKHVEIINHSVYPKDDLSTESTAVNLYKLVYKTIDFAAIREPISFRIMRFYGVEAVESFDALPLYIRQYYQKHGTKAKKTLLVAGSSAWMNCTNVIGGYKSSVSDHESSLTNFALYLTKMWKNGYTINFLFGAQNYPAQDDIDLIQLMELVLAKFGCMWNVVTASSVDDWLNHIEGATLLVSGRFHHSIAAACLGTPFISLNANTPKVDGMLEVLGKQPSFKYNDPEILEKLRRETEVILSGPDKTAQVLDILAEKAERNFLALRKLALDN